MSDVGMGEDDFEQMYQEVILGFEASAWQGELRRRSGAGGCRSQNRRDDGPRVARILHSG